MDRMLDWLPANRSLLCINSRLCYSNLKYMEISLYFHVPFCRRRCGYCDFNTFAGMETRIPDYVKALCLEVESVLVNAPESLTVRTVYFGGGTPSLLDPEQFQEIIKVVLESTNLIDNAEISLEANPETVTFDKISGFREAGFNRISLGMQSASRFDLKILEREHRNASLLNAVEWCRKARFEHTNLDLMFGIPGQSLESWMITLELALGLGVDHFSLYSLILEEGTRLKRYSDKGLIVAQDEDLAADMYEAAMVELERAGYGQYEISNWAIGEEARCRHNLQYWRYLPYLGFGAGAHGFYGNTRVENLSTIDAYINRVTRRASTTFPAGPTCLAVNHLTRWEMMQEHLMVAMRLTDEGILLADFSKRYGVSIEEVFPSQLKRLLHDGLIDYAGNGKTLRLTKKGALFGNRVFSAFIDNQVPAGYEYLLDQ